MRSPCIHAPRMHACFIAFITYMTYIQLHTTFVYTLYMEVATMLIFQYQLTPDDDVLIHTRHASVPRACMHVF
jgi:hypothetical protein